MKNKILYCLLAIIVICLFIFGVFYFKNNKEESNVYNHLDLAKEKIPVVLSLINQENLYTYCGKIEGSVLDKEQYYYSISANFKSLNELKSFLNVFLE